MAAALPAIAIGMVAVGALASASSSIRQGNAANDAAQYNAALSRRNVQIALDQAQADADSQDRQARKTLGQMRANYAASGLRLEGTPLDVLQESATTAELDRQNILYHGRLRAMGYEDTARLDEAGGRNARTRGYEQAASSLLTGGAKAAGMSGAGTGGGYKFSPGDYTGYGDTGYF